MSDPISDSERRPNQLSPIYRMAVGSIILAGFASGVLVWIGQAGNPDPLDRPAWLRPAMVLHGGLFPIHCILLGSLIQEHVRTGIRMKTNLWSGASLLAVFAALILTGGALYYAGGESFRTALIWTHRVLGVVFPALLGIHWRAGVRLPPRSRN